jgi:hypothetical chaperone protein
MGLHVGVDFGTSNTAVARAGTHAADAAEVLPVERVGAESRLVRSVLFFPEETREILAGQGAIDRYMADGEGRLLQSMKTFLPSTSFSRTEIRNRAHAIDDIVAMFLRPLRERVEQVTGDVVTHAVFGRPAVFSDDAGRDALAEERLRTAAVRAGFPDPVFVIEPIAAALAYEQALTHDEVVLVGDFGAGTSDFTLMRLGPSYRGRRERRDDVLASGGVPIGGDRFDAAIVEHALLGLFGHRSTYKSMLKRLELPVWVTRKLLAWNELSVLREPSTMRFLNEVLASSDAPAAVGRIVTLVDCNLGYRLYRAVEAAKVRLSASDEARVTFREVDIDLDVPVTRDDFESWTAPLREGDAFTSVAAGLGRASLLDAMASGGRT